MPIDEGLHRELTAKLVDAAIEVHRILGPGFVESIYEEAFAHELDLRGIKFERQKTIQVPYKEIRAGEHRLDLLIEGVMVVELKAIKDLTDVDLARMLSYLKATGLEVELFLNFAKPRMKDGIRRVARSQPANIKEFLCVLCVSAVIPFSHRDLTRSSCPILPVADRDAATKRFAPHPPPPAV